jgi:hypothetical protein
MGRRTGAKGMNGAAPNKCRNLAGRLIRVVVYSSFLAMAPWARAQSKNPGGGFFTA